MDPRSHILEALTALRPQWLGLRYPVFFESGQASFWSFFPLRLSFFCYSWKSQCLGPHLPKITGHYFPALSPTWILSAVVIDLHSLQNFSSCLHCLLCPPKNIDLSPAYPFPPGFIAQPLQ